MRLIKGKPDLRFKVYKNGILVSDFILDGYTDFEEDYEPVFLSHELDNNEILRKLDGFRYRARVHFEEVDGSKLLNLAIIVTKGDYDKILFFPNSIDKPLYYLDVTIDDDTVKLSTIHSRAQKDFELKLVGRKLEDWVPMTLADFTTWGNISLKFSDLNLPFNSYMRTVQQTVIGLGRGNIIASTAGYFQKILPSPAGNELIGGALNGSGTFKTDFTTIITLSAIPQTGEQFYKWAINGVDYSTEQLIELVVLNNLTIEAFFIP